MIEPNIHADIPPEQLSYEDALSELERIVAALESDDQTLEAGLSLFERGQALAQHCAKLLDQAELKVRLLSGDALEDFQIDAES
jgi:exodeoxyribonuclease VII small subunit